MQGLADNLGYQVASLPTKYLGMPLGAKNKKFEVWSEVLERSERKLTRWKSQYISLGGRLTLIKSVLDALPTYMLSLFPLPKSIGKKLNKLRRCKGDLHSGEWFEDQFLERDLVSTNVDPQGWDLRFRRALNDWEVGRVADLPQALNLFPGTVTEPDKPFWRLHSRGGFTVKSCYWERNTNHFLTTVWPWKLI
ncbi:hypothetical protein H5410_045954 [Solanum commersonii]|uniref:Reverse transcriptase n=1 Tax=Solanum commersonii TaxID=4109 RepID=A0A9J5XF55_SOLCO|nr:hypothetical protein H5410_045954 [Solanum commersonii]